MRKNPEFLAWIILTISFFICIGLALSVPLGGRWYILNARVTQRVTLEVQRGPLRVTMAGRGAAVAIAEVRDEIPERTVVATADSTVSRFVMHTPSEDGPVIATVQMYDNTEVALSSARSPRFSASHLPHEIALQINAGRVRINIPGDDDRDTVVKIQTPHGTGLLTEGSYEVQINAATKVTVRYGQATIAGLDTPIGPGEYATCDSECASGPSPAAPNLISNGYFHSPLESGWTSYANQEEEPPGSVEIVEEEGQKVANFYRNGSDHAEVGIRQEVNCDVHDFTSLRLHLSVYIVEQSLPVCGDKGSECPVMVRIIYEEANGAEQEWLQGFYSLPNTDPNNENPLVCTTCSTRNSHIQVRENTWYPYLSPNLIPRLSSQDGEPPTTIKSVTIYASGHSYGSMIADVELVGHK